MKENPKSHLFVDATFSILSFLYVFLLLHYAVEMWETTQRFSVIFLTLTLMLASLMALKQRSLLTFTGNTKNFFAILFFILSLAGGIYFWTEYSSLVWERAGAINNPDYIFSIIFVTLVIFFTWNTSGHIIPTVTLVFVSYALFGHWIPGFFHHPPIRLVRFMAIACAEMDGIFGMLPQIGATWIAIFAFLAGFIQGFGGLDFIVRIMYQVVGRKSVRIPQVAVLSSMALGAMSGSTSANAAGTGAFTIPTMKQFGIPPAHAASIEAIASSGGQIMPPILGATAFVMCDYLGKNYTEILFASIFGSLIFFGSTMLSVHFIAKRFIAPDADTPSRLSKKFSGIPSLQYVLQGLPILICLATLLFVFIAYQVNILLGGFYTVVSFLVSRFIYDMIVHKFRIHFLIKYLRDFYDGIILGARMMISIEAMLACLGIIVRVLTTTGLGEKISYTMVDAFGNNFILLLILTMVICIIFGMAVSTVAAYILVVTLAAPALIKIGVDPLAAHFSVFYWAMLSAFTPPVAAACVITAGIAKASFMRTCWESMKLGLPKFIMPYIFIAYPSILSLTWEGFVAFFIASVGFAALSAGIQSGWGYIPQIILTVLGFAVLFIPAHGAVWFFVVPTAILMIVFWRRYNPKVHKYHTAPNLNTV